MRNDATRPQESFGKEFTRYLEQLPWDSMIGGDEILKQIWCRPGRSGVIVLLVGLYWQAVYSGGGKEWKGNIT